MVATWIGFLQVDCPSTCRTVCPRFFRRWFHHAKYFRLLVPFAIWIGSCISWPYFFLCKYPCWNLVTNGSMDCRTDRPHQNNGFYTPAFQYFVDRHSIDAESEAGFSF